MRIIWRTAMSMDGRLADKDDGLQFLETIDDRDAALGDFPEFLASMDAIILGATTLRWLIRNGHGWPHGDIRTWLVSHDAGLERQVGETVAPFRRFEGDMAALVAEMEADGRNRAWLCGGGDIAGQLLAIDRIDEVEATIAPVALGAGPSLFGSAPLAFRAFTLTSSRTFGNAVEIKWRRN
jgi:riboflavin biosynthesis pyrimidine reductase